MTDIYLGLGIALTVLGLVAGYALFRWIRERYESWVFVESEVYQNRTTHDVVIVPPGVMVFDEEKDAYIKSVNQAKRVYLYDKIEDDEENK